MKKISDIAGMKVLDSRGKLIGEVEKVVYSRSRNKIPGIILKRNRLIKNHTAVQFKDIISFGGDVLIINPNSTVNPSNVVEISRIFEEELDITGYRVYTSEGIEIGTIKDLLFDETSGVVQGYLLAGDFVEDLMNGRKILRLDDISIIGEGTIILNNGSVDYSALPNSGLKNLLGLDE